MKYTIKLLGMLLICTLVFASCKKESNENQNTSKTRIASVKNSVGDSTSMVVTEINEYTWNGEVLSKIVLKNGNGYNIGVYIPKYDDKNRLKEYTIGSGGVTNGVYKFSYNDANDLVRIDYFDYNNELEDYYLITMTNGKVTEIAHYGMGDDEEKAFDALRFIMPEHVANAVAQSTSITKDFALETVNKFTWEGNNIVKFVTLIQGESSDYDVTYEWTYDDKINPLQTIYVMSFFYHPDQVYSANNIVTEVSTLPLVNPRKTTYTYEYNGEYPVKRNGVTSGADFSDGNRKTVTEYTYLN